MSQLEPCPHCHRHVKLSETACPFCAAPLDFSQRTARVGPGARLGRAAVFAFGAAAASCGDNGSKPDAFIAPAVDARPDAHADATPDAHPDAAPDATPDADLDGGGIPIYAAAPTDAGSGTRSVKS